MNHNRYPDPWTITHYRGMGFGRDLIIRAWTECRGNQNFLLDRIIQLSKDHYKPYSQRTPQLMTTETARLLKKLPRTYHLQLKFEGNDCLKYLELRKLGLFSKKAFRDTRGLSLKYLNPHGGKTQKTEHMEILGNHMYQNLRKLKYLSIEFDFWNESEAVSARPLLQSLKQTFVGLVHLKLSLGGCSLLSEWELLSYDRLFARLGSTLKHLDLDFAMSDRKKRFGEIDIKSFPEDLGVIIIKRLHKLESLALNFNWSKFSTKLVRFLINAAGTHLPCLRSLSLSFEGFEITQEDESFYSSNNQKSSLQHLKLKLNYCPCLTLEYLSLLRFDILNLCPLLNEFYLSTLNSRITPNFFSDMEKEFCENLPIKKLKILSSSEPSQLEKDWNRYQEIERVEMRPIITMEEEIEEMMKMKAKVGGEEEWELYYQTKMEEERAPKGYEEIDQQEYLQKRLDEQERIELEECDRIERDIRFEEVEEEIYNDDDDPNSEEYHYYRHEMLENDLRDLNQHIEEEQAAIDLAEEKIRHVWEVEGDYY